MLLCNYMQLAIYQFWGSKNGWIIIQAAFVHLVGSGHDYKALQ